jgi:subtilisin family serine protease
MTPLDLVTLSRMLDFTSGSSAVRIGLVDGPVTLTHPVLETRHIRELPGGNGACIRLDSPACLHGTFVAGILAGRRGSPAPAICPDCTLFIRPIFTEAATEDGAVPTTAPEELAQAILDCIGAGAQVLNLSAALAQPSTESAPALRDALDEAARRGVLVVATAGNQGRLGSTAITRHPWVIPVVAYDSGGRFMNQSNLGHSIGRRGLGAPGERVTSLGSDGRLLTLSGTSVAAPFVTGAIALLYSLFPQATAGEVKLAVLQGAAQTLRPGIVPPLLDAWRSYQLLLSAQARTGLQ